MTTPKLYRIEVTLTAYWLSSDGEEPDLDEANTSIKAEVRNIELGDIDRAEVTTREQLGGWDTDSLVYGTGKPDTTLAAAWDACGLKGRGK